MSNQGVLNQRLHLIANEEAMTGALRSKLGVWAAIRKRGEDGCEKICHDDMRE